LRWWRGGGSASGSGGGDIPPNPPVNNAQLKEEIRLAALSANNLAASIMNDMDQIIGNAVVNVECNNLSASVTSKFTINSVVHTAYASGQVKLYNGSKALTCDDILNSNSLRIDTGEVNGSGYIHGSELNSDFQGTFKVTGSDGYLASLTSSEILISDYFFINGSGMMTGNKLEGISYPDVSGTVNNVKVDMQQGLDLIFSIMSGNTFHFGYVARIIKDGHIYAETPDCSSIDIHFNGTNLIDVSSPCTSPAQFKVNVDSGAIIE
jgi:hypothetical protein